MSVVALRRVMALLEHGLDETLAAAFYELLSTAEVHVPFDGQNVTLHRGPGGQAAIPVFLDETALRRYAGSSVVSSVMPVRRAAQLAFQMLDVWLVVDQNSSPGSQPIAQRGVEALALGAFPYAERYAPAWQYARELAEAAGRGRLDAELIRKAAGVRMFTIGSSEFGAEVAPGVHSVSAMTIQIVRDAHQRPFVAAWPSPGPSFAFMPDAPSRLVQPFENLVDSALRSGWGIVIDPQGLALGLPHLELATLWRA